MKQLFTRKLMLLAVMLLAGVGSSFAFEHEGLTYRVVDNDAKTVKVSYQGSEPSSNPYTQSSIVIPSTVPFNGSSYTVVEIGERAFMYASISTIDIAPTVKTIGDEAFAKCQTITSIDLSNIEFFGSAIFDNCRNLVSVTLPKTLQSIPNSMFSNCSNITSFTFSDNITSIGSGAFQGTGLTSVTITCRDIGSNAFAYCQQLTKVTLLSDGYMVSSNQFSGSNKINMIVCLGRFSGSVDLGFSDNVKEDATVYVPKSQMNKWSSFLNVNEVTISNVGKHVIDVYPYNYNGDNYGRVLINGEYTDCLYGNTLLAEPGSNVEVEFINNSSYDYYEIETFTLNGSDMTSSVVDNKYTITNVSGNQTIQTTWKEGDTYNINMSYMNCDVFINGDQVWGGNYKYLSNKDYTVLIKPNTGYDINTFTVNYNDKKSDLVKNSDGSYSYTFKLNSDTELDIYCAEKWSLTTTFNAGGSVTVGGESATSGTTKEIVGAMSEVVVKANQGYEITSVLYNGTEYLANMNTWSSGEKVFWPTSDQGTNQTLDVTFTIVNPTISANYDTMQGSVSIAGSQLMPTMPQSFAIGSNVTFTITPNLGYEISSVMLNGPTSTDITAAVIANSNSYTISNINDSYTIDVTFAAIPTPATVTATIGTLGMATLYSPYALDFSGVAGLKAYIVSAFTPANNRAILTQVYDVPAKTSVVLVGAAADYTIPTTTTKTYVANLLRGADCDMKMNSTDGVYTNYILADGTNGLGFYVIQDGSTLNAGKAYLAIPNDATSPAPSFVVMNLNGMDVTGIESIEKAASNMAGNAIYNLNGQRQSGLKKGINIVGGKKIVVK